MFSNQPLPSLTARQARMNNSVTDAVNLLLAKTVKRPSPGLIWLSVILYCPRPTLLARPPMVCPCACIRPMAR
jgi:hypothetical protein